LVSFITAYIQVTDKKYRAEKKSGKKQNIFCSRFTHSFKEETMSHGDD